MIRSRLFPLLAALLLVACSNPAPTSIGPLPPKADGTLNLDGAVAVLELHALDIWAQPLPEDAELTVTYDGSPVQTVGWPLASVALAGPGDYLIALSADDHETLEVAVAFDGNTILVDSGPAYGHGVSVSHSDREGLPLHTVHLGLRHLWFSAQGRPARRGNRLDFMMDGETAWGRVADEIETATDTVHLSTWWWDSNFELRRGDPESHASSSEAQRRQNSIIGMLDSSSAEKRVLVGQIWGQDGVLVGSWLTTDDMIHARGEAGSDGFEFMGQANTISGMFLFQVPPHQFQDVLQTRVPSIAGRMFEPELPIESTVPPHNVDLTDFPIDIELEHASWHQKFGIIDGRVAFIGGMNFRPVDWDTNQHEVFDARRMGFDATSDDRLAVLLREDLPDSGPRKDYMMRIEGPAAQDAEEVFQTRWHHQIDMAADYADRSSRFEVNRALRPFEDGVQAQVTATMPAPFHEYAIAETWFNAVANAEDYIFIEDQYFRIPMLVDLIVERMTMMPELELIVVTKPVSEWTDPGCEWTARTHEELTMRFPARYHTYQLRSWDVVETWGVNETEERFTNIDVHSKLLIVDDVFLSVGSCNKNNRGIVYEGELNVAVLDEAFVADAMRRVLANMLPAGTVVAADSAGWIAQLEASAQHNQEVFDAWDAVGGDISLDGAALPEQYIPDGFVYPLSFRGPDYCLIEGVGPDMM